MILLLIFKGKNPGTKEANNRGISTTTATGKGKSLGGNTGSRQENKKTGR